MSSIFRAPAEALAQHPPSPKAQGARRKAPGFSHPARRAAALKKRADEEAADAQRLALLDDEAVLALMLSQVPTYTEVTDRAVRQSDFATDQKSKYRTKGRYQPAPPHQRGKANQRGTFPVHRPQRSGSKRVGV